MAEIFRKSGLKTHDFQESLLDTASDWSKFLQSSDQLSHSDRINLLKKIFKNYDAATDTPSYLFWNEISEAFPNCKFIFYQREEEAWLKSFLKQMEINNNLSYIPTFLTEIAFYFLAPKSRQMKFVQEYICPLVTGQAAGYLRDWKLQQFRFNTTLLLEAYRSIHARYVSRGEHDIGIFFG